MDFKRKRQQTGYQRRKLAGKSSHERSLNKSILSRSIKTKNRSSSFQNVTLKANNRALARALADLRSQFGLAHEQNLHYQFEQQSLLQRINELQHLLNLQPKDVERKIHENYQKKFSCMEDGLNNVGLKLMEAVDILSNLLQCCTEINANSSAAEESALNQNTSYISNASIHSSQQNIELANLTNNCYSNPINPTGKFIQNRNSRSFAESGSMFNMSVILEQSQIEEQKENILEEVGERQKEASLGKRKSKRSNSRRWSRFFNLPPLGMTLGQDYEEEACKKYEPRTAAKSASPELEPISSGQTKNLMPISEDDKKEIITISVTPTSPVLSVDIEALLQKHNANKQASPSRTDGTNVSIRRKTFLVKESKQILPFPFYLDSPCTKECTATESKSCPKNLFAVDHQEPVSVIPAEDNSSMPIKETEIVTNLGSSSNKGNDESPLSYKSHLYKDLSEWIGKQNTVLDTKEINNDIAVSNEYVELLYAKPTLLANDEETSPQPKKFNQKKRIISSKKATSKDNDFKPRKVKVTKQMPVPCQADNIITLSNLQDNPEEISLLGKENVNLHEADEKQALLKQKTPKIKKKMKNRTSNTEQRKKCSNTPERKYVEGASASPTEQRKEKKKSRRKKKVYNVEDIFSEETIDTNPLENIEEDSVKSNFPKNGKVTVRNNDIVLKDIQLICEEQSYSNPSVPHILAEYLSIDEFDSSSEAVQKTDRRERRRGAEVPSYKLRPLNSKLRRP